MKNINVYFKTVLISLFHVPMYLLSGVLNVEWFTGKTLAIISLFLSRPCLLINIVNGLLPLFFSVQCLDNCPYSAV